MALPAVSNAASMACSTLYEAGLKIVLRHRFITLMVMFGTIALTGYLYVDHSQGLLSRSRTPD